MAREETITIFSTRREYVSSNITKSSINVLKQLSEYEILILQLVEMFNSNRAFRENGGK